LSIPDGIAYVRTPLAQLEGKIDEDTEAMRLYRLGQESAPRLSAASPIVLQPQIEPSSVQAIMPRGYFLSPETTQIPIHVWINNLGPEPREVRVTLENIGEFPVRVEGLARKEIFANVDVSKLSFENEANDIRWLKISAASDGGERVAPAALGFLVQGQGSVAETLKACKFSFELPLDEAFRWEGNANGEIVFHSGPPWGYKVKFAPGVDRWAFPRYTPPQEVDYRKITGLLLRARCEKNAIVRVMAWTGTDHDASYTDDFSIFPSDGEWHDVYVPFASFLDCKEDGTPTRPITKFSVGLNSEHDENTLEISDLYLIGK